MFTIAHNDLESSTSPIIDSNNFKIYCDTLEKLRLIKSNIGMITSLADRYSKEMGKSFSELLKTGICSAVKAVKNYKGNDEEKFNEYLRREVSKAMLGLGSFKTFL